MDFWLVLSKNYSNIICSSIKNESFLKIWGLWHILKVCHALRYLKIEMSIAGSIFELHPPNFQKMCIFWRFTNDISTIFCYLLWFQFWKKCQSLPVHPRVVPALTKTFSPKWWSSTFIKKVSKQEQTLQFKNVLEKWYLHSITKCLKPLFLYKILTKTNQKSWIPPP